MKKMGCASCGGAMKKMQKGGSAEIVGMPKYGNNPRTSTGAMLKKGGVAKAKFGASVPVQHSPAPGRVRSASGVGTVPVGKRKMGGVTKKLVKAQKGISTYSSKHQVGTDKDYAGNDQYSDSYSKAYKTTPKGKIISRSMASKKATTVGGSAITSYPEKTTVLDTSGYSQGRQTFPAKKAIYNIADINYDWDITDPNSKPGTTNFSEWDVPRSRVKKTIAEMKSNSGANKSKGTKVNYNSAGTKTVVHTGANGKKYVKVTDKEGKTYNKIMKMGGSLKAVPSDKLKSLGKLPTAVRNKMGFQKKGGAVKKK